MNSLLKKPSAWAPVAISFTMLAFILTYIAMYGVVAPDPNVDEGTPAHIFQLWMVVEALAIGYFAFRWLPEMPKQTLAVLALQIAAALMPLVIVFYLEM